MIVPQKQLLTEKPVSAPVRVVQPQPVSTPPSGGGIDVLDILQRRWLLAATIFIVCATAGLYWIYTQVKPTYQAETTIYVSPKAMNEGGRGDNLSYLTLINQQILTITHYDTLSRALQRLETEGHPWKRPAEGEQKAIARLRASLTVMRIPESYEIAISASGPDPLSVARTANAVAAAYLDQGSGQDATERSVRIDSLTRQKAELEKQLRENFDTEAKMSGTLQVANLDKIGTLPDDAVLAQMRVAYAGAHQKRVEQEQQLVALEKSGATAEAEQIITDPGTRIVLANLLQEQDDLRTRLGKKRTSASLRKAADADKANAMIAESVKALNDELGQLNHDVAQKEAALAVLRRNYTEKHPDVIDSTTNLAALKKQRDQLAKDLTALNSHRDQSEPANPVEADDDQTPSVPPELVHKLAMQLKDRLQAQVEQAKLTEVTLGHDVADYSVGLEKTSRQLHDAQSVSADVERLRARLRSVQDQIDSLNVADDPHGFLRVFSLAKPPLQPVKNKISKAIAMLLALVLFMSLAIPVMLDTLDPRIYNSAGLEVVLGFPPLGITLEQKPGIEELEQEQVRRLAAGIERGIARGARTIVLAPLKFGASHDFGEEMVRILSDSGYQTIVIDADRQRFRLSAVAPAINQAECNALDLFDSAIREAGREGDVVLINTPPLLLSAEAELLASRSDLTLMIVRAGVNTRNDVRRAGRLLERLNVAAVGAILSGVRIERAGRSLRSEFKEYLVLRSSQARSGSRDKA